MPVTIKSSAHGANAINALSGYASNTEEALRGTCPSRKWDHGELLQSSMGAGDMPPNLMSSDNGLVRSIIQAYSQHHHLVIRPEDIWFAILT